MVLRLGRARTWTVDIQLILLVLGRVPFCFDAGQSCRLRRLDPLVLGRATFRFDGGQSRCLQVPRLQFLPTRC